MKITFTLIVLFFSVELMAQKAGTLDSSFGNDGFFLKSILPYGDIYGTTLQSDGRALAVGNAGHDFSIFRFTADGLPDQSFGDSGMALAYFAAFDQSFATAVGYQSDNKILVSGYAYTGMFTHHVQYTGIIIRLNNSGIIDSSFGTNGSIQTSNEGQGGYGPMAVLPDNSFFIIGNSGSSEFINHFLENGELDKSFGQNGYSYVSTNSSYNKLKIQADNKIVVAGSYSQLGIPEFLLQRYLSNGTIDNSFGNSGTVITDYAPYGGVIYDLGFQSDGKIIAFGYCALDGVGDLRFATARYLTNGTLDSSFGVEGKSTIAFNNSSSSSGRSMAVMANDQIVVGGSVVNNAVPNTADFGIARLNSNGTLDSTFGNDGQTMTDLGMNDYIKGVFLQQSDKIVTIGESYNQPQIEYNCSIARYNNDPTKKQIIIQKIKHYIQTHNDAQATTLNNVSIYPNPVQNILHVEGLSSRNAKLTVVDFAGNIIVSRELSPVPSNTGVVSNGYDLNVASLHAGNYLLKIETNGVVVTKQFVKE